MLGERVPERGQTPLRRMAEPADPFIAEGHHRLAPFGKFPIKERALGEGGAERVPRPQFGPEGLAFRLRGRKEDRRLHLDLGVARAARVGGRVITGPVRRDMIGGSRPSGGRFAAPRAVRHLGATEREPERQE